ncbi:hypothetical protein JZ751_011272 [Albula glossodonta]|uniref:asparaginase n=1 Tax=Albula glossodonta TaxID=121402 RepID=A0A8T2NYU4_9TELE|nr:hypothetical protein JZ751_011272 [Albula glossodonta]
MTQPRKPDCSPFLISPLFFSPPGGGIVDQVRSALEHAGGVVLASFGAGNVPSFDWLQEAVKEASKREVLFLNCSQVFKGVVVPIYDVSSAGVVSGRDITPEAALTKMIWVLQEDLSYTERKKLLGLDL